MTPVRCKRIYLPVSSDDGARVLVERLWPRGVSKADAALDLWLKDVAPSPGLRRWYAHDPARWDAFRQRYLDELDARDDEIAQLLALADHALLTLVYAARDVPGTGAQVLCDYLNAKISRRDG